MTIRDRSFGWRSVLAIVSVAVAAAVIITIVAGHALVNDATAHQESDGATVRISALKADGGAVHVALQQQDSSGGWGERLHPDRNTVRDTARTGVWLHSSPLQLATASAENGPLYCIAAHGGPDDYFWRLVRGYIHAARTRLDINVRYSSSLDGAEQAAAINQCVADGAVAIASTLADADAVGDSLRAARAAGIYVLTFNSGAEHARSVPCSTSGSTTTRAGDWPADPSMSAASRAGSPA